MKRLVPSFVAVSLFVSIAALAEELVQVPTEQFLGSLWQFIGGVGAMKGLALVAGVVQILMLFFRTSLSNFAGKYRLLIVLALTLVASVVTLMSQGLPLMAALMHGTTLGSLQVLGHQLWKQFVEKKDESAPTA